LLIFSLPSLLTVYVLGLSVLTLCDCSIRLWNFSDIAVFVLFHLLFHLLAACLTFYIALRFSDHVYVSSILILIYLMLLPL
jgi:hypothetical protein